MNTIDIPKALADSQTDASFLIGFAIAFLISVLFGNKFVAARLRKHLNLKSDDTSNSFDLPYAKKVGNLERVFYIYAVMTAQYGIISGWLVMKAFYGWLKPSSISSPSEAAPGEVAGKAVEPDDSNLHAYHIYLLGTGLSLLVGIICGRIAMICQSVAHQLLP